MMPSGEKRYLALESATLGNIDALLRKLDTLGPAEVAGPRPGLHRAGTARRWPVVALVLVTLAAVVVALIYTGILSAP
jgi:hypothetical protein